MSLDATKLKEKIVEALQGGDFPASAPAISQAIQSYVMANGTPKPPTISYVLGPCSGTGWTSLVPLASSKGVGDKIISVGIAAEFAASTKVVPGVPPATVPMVFNTSAKVADLTEVYDFDEVWQKISEAIVDFFSTEIE